MGKIKKYQQFIIAILSEYAKIRYSNIDAENQLVADKEHHRYQIMTYKQNCPSAIANVLHFSKALFLKLGITNSQYFVNY